MFLYSSLFVVSKKTRARPGFEPGTSRTLSENHTPRPTSQLNIISATSSVNFTWSFSYDREEIQPTYKSVKNYGGWQWRHGLVG